MKRFFKNYRLPENTEVLFLLTVGIVLQMTDGSPFALEEKLKTVWDTELPAEHFSQFVQKCIKTVLSMIVTVRCLTTYAYVGSGLVVFCCILKDGAPKLILFWLFLSGLKSICLTFLEALTGVYVCSAFGKIRKVCIEFFISKALEIIFAVYLWGNVLGVYQKMQKKIEDIKMAGNWMHVLSQNKNLRRHKARSLLDESTLYKTACLNYFEFKDVPQIILQMLKREEEMSQDSLLGPGMMLESVSNMGSFDNLKTSQSLGELGFIDLKSVQVLGLDDDAVLTPQDKALKFLKLTWSDVRRAQNLRSDIDSTFHSVDQETWDRVMASSTNINKYKTPRTEVFIHEISQEESREEVERNKRPYRKNSLELKFGISLFDFFREKNAELQQRDEDQLSEGSSQGEEEDGEERSSDEEEERKIKKHSLFMSNIREEVPVNRIRLDFISKATVGNAYANLYIQDYMSVIGPEVFDKATKLPKVTSLTKVTRRQEMRMSASLPTLSKKSKKKINFDDESVEKGQVTSKSVIDVIPTISKSNRYEFYSTENFVFINSRLNSIVSPQSSDKAENKQLIHDKFLSPSGSHEDEEKSIKSENLIKMESYTSDRKFSGESSKEEVTGRISMSSQNEKSGFSVQSERENKNTEQPEESFKKGSDCTEIRERAPCFRHKKITVKRRQKTKTKAPCKRKLLRHIKVLIKKSNNSFDSNRSHVSSSKTVSDQKERNSHKKEVQYFTSNSFTSCDEDTPGNEPFSNINNKQIYFLTELLQRPLTEVLATYFDLKMKMHVERKANPFINLKNYLFESCDELKEFEKNSPTLQFERKISRGWKSKVLETVSSYGTPNRDCLSPSFRFKNDLILNKMNDELSIRGLSSSKQSLLMDKTSVLFNASRQLKDKVDFSLIDKQNLRLPDRSSSLTLHAWSCDSFPSSICTENYAKEDFHSLSESNSLDRYFSLLNLKNTALTPTSDENKEFSENKEKSSDPQKCRYLVLPTYWDESDDCHNNFISSQTCEREMWDEDLSVSPSFEVKTEITKPEECSQQINEQDNLDILSTSGISCSTLEEDSPCSKESDESFSLYYSKAADLTSPLMDMKRFIYPDHIHYSYKHVKKKGFDVDISGGLPLLVQESLTMNSPIHMKNVSSSKSPASEITRRPMDLSFASTNAFTEWQSNEQVVADAVVTDSKTSKICRPQTVQSPRLKGSEKKFLDIMLSKSKNIKKIIWKNDQCDDHNLQKNELKKKSKLKPQSFRNCSDTNDVDSNKDYPLIKKLLKMQNEKNIKRNAGAGKMEKSRTPIQISSTQLHSNKGRINSTYNPALFLQENKARNAGEKRKTETQEERTKKMFARLEREVLLQSKNFNKTFENLKM